VILEAGGSRLEIANQKSEIRNQNPQRRSGFTDSLIGWYRQNKRAMPWRGTRDAYRIWISEIMLQQTRVAVVIPYYQRFVKKFPTVHALARARPGEVLRHWAGLGYYSRARNLHRAARAMVWQHDGEFPHDAAQALALPGVGRYTAAAVLSIAYGEPQAVLDGNVARVLARLRGLRGELRKKGRWLRLERMAQEWMNAAVTEGKGKRGNRKGEGKPPGGHSAGRAAGEWNQAMMELGATVCTPRSPNCAACPVSKQCRARILGLQEKIPPARKEPIPVRLTIAAAVLVDRRNKTLLTRPAEDNCAELFSRMWQFPAVRVKQDAKRELWRHLSALTNSVSFDLDPLAPARHAVTYRNIELAPFLARLDPLPLPRGARAVPLKTIDSLPISNATRKIAHAALRELQAAPRAAR